MTNGNGFDLEPMLEMYVFESKQLLEQLEDILLEVEGKNRMNENEINEVFRIMHTLKGSAAMMMIDTVRDVAHAVEDVFAIIRNNPLIDLDYRALTDLILKSIDMMSMDIRSLEMMETIRTDTSNLTRKIKSFEAGISEGEHNRTEASEGGDNPKYYVASQHVNLDDMNIFRVHVSFQKGCEMENIRAFTLIHNLNDDAHEILHRPIDIIDDPRSSFEIAENGFELFIITKSTKENLNQIVEGTMFVENYSIVQDRKYLEDIKQIRAEMGGTPLTQEEAPEKTILDSTEETVEVEHELMSQTTKAKSQNMISVKLEKLDKLMDLVGEIVITESMVTQNPDLEGLDLESFSKSARQLRKLTDELQDIVMDIRMLPITGLFQKMKRIVRDMGKKLDKEVILTTDGEETELDKTILDMLSDPMMHLIRNAMDHGIETGAEREQLGKESQGQLFMGARSSGGDVIVSLKDDGRGIDRDKVLEKAREHGILTKPESEMTDKEINSLILHPGFSTKEDVTEFSGRGVGMDVVKKNIEKIGGSITIESEVGKGTLIEIKIPLTLAIIEGMEVSVGRSRYTIPTISIKESFKPESKNIVSDPEGNEMIMVRGKCYPIVRLHRFFNIKTSVSHLLDGILVMVENEREVFCLFADELLGEQQVVVKPLPLYVHKFVGDIKGISGCTILGNGDMSLILDVAGL